MTTQAITFRLVHRYRVNRLTLQPVADGGVEREVVIASSTDLAGLRYAADAYLDRVENGSEDEDIFRAGDWVLEDDTLGYFTQTLREVLRARCLGPNPSGDRETWITFCAATLS